MRFQGSSLDLEFMRVKLIVPLLSYLSGLVYSF